MNWTTAWLTMKQGYKVKRHHWKNAYWHIAARELMIHTEQGSDINFREVSDMGMFISLMCCDDWELVEENDGVSEKSV